ncbi:MAG: cyclic 2,3-diphosphoglycerate synthase [Nitrospiraceae bacterium]|nr:cyclic 2,3-diphosphoglycerate synthase [Nitrospiraceae bacterium]
MKRQKIIIMGAAGRDFHNFNMVFKNNPYYDVAAFTAAQIPYIERRTYPPELAGYLYPSGIPIFPEEELETLIGVHGVQQVVFAYSDVSHEYVMHKASLCLSLGTDFLLLGPEQTMLVPSRPAISVCSVRTGCGKSGVTRYVLRLLRERGLEPAAIRHPMPYCDLLEGRAQRFRTMEDLDAWNCTIEEREEFEPLIRMGVAAYAGVDYEMVLKEAEKEANVIVWDGGNNDMPFIRPGLEIVVLDPHRPGHELLYHPGETNLRRADIAVINKVDTAEKDNIRTVEDHVRMVNPSAIIAHTASRIIVDNPGKIEGRSVLVVEDGPTLTHGGMSYGAGLLASKKYGASGIVDPRPYAEGSIKEMFRKYPQISNVLPAMGYAPEQMRELRETIERVPADLVVVATPIDLRGLLGLSKDSVHVGYEIEESEGMELKGSVEGFADSQFHAYT